MKKYVLTLFMTTITLSAFAYQRPQTTSNPPPRAPQPTRPSTGREEIAYLDRERDLYNRYDYQDDWNYRQNWQSDPQAYLNGQNQPPQQNYPSQVQYQRQNNNQYSTNNQYHKDTRYNEDSGNRNIHYNSTFPDPDVPYDYLNWDYRQNWQYNPGPYLRGEDQNKYIERHYKAKPEPGPRGYYDPSFSKNSTSK